MKKHNMDINKLIEELIELSNTKHGLVKIGHDTLNIDVLFITRFEELKEELNVESLNDLDMSMYPRIKDLQESIKKINELDKNIENRNLRMKNASNAYKK